MWTELDELQGDLLGADTGDPLWVPPTFTRGWPESVLPQDRHLLSPDLCAIAQARAAREVALRQRAQAPLAAARLEAVWVYAKQQTRRTLGMAPWETRFMAEHARLVLRLLSDETRTAVSA